MYICKRCEYKTERKANLIKHLERKNKCQVKNEDVSTEFLLDEIMTVKHVEGEPYECEFCSRTFNDRSNMNKHMLVCKKRRKTEIEEIEDKILEIKFLQMQSEKGVLSPNDINTFGNETLQHLNTDFLTSCFVFHDFERLIEKIYFSKGCPQNHTVHLKSLKKNFVRICVNGEWRTKITNDVLDDIINKAYNILINHYENNITIIEEKINDDKLKEVLEWFKKVSEGNIKIRYRLRNQILAVLDTYRN